MITYKLGKHTYKIPTGWHEMRINTPNKFIRMCMAFEMFERGEMDFHVLRIAVASQLLGVDLQLVPRTNEILFENLFRLVEKIEFPYRITKNEDQSLTAAVSICLCKNLLPHIGRRKGYKFRISKEGLIDTDITAQQYVDVLDLMEVYSTTWSDEALDGIFDTLYPGRGYVSRPRKVAVYYNFRGILEYIKQLPDFRLVFATGGKRRGGANPLGLAASILTLSKSGYGTLNEIRTLDLFTYLGALVQLDIDGILSLQSAGCKPGEIAEKMNLPFEEVLPYVTVNQEEEK
ncbi:MAG: hypothetical protein ACI3ZQ_04980 [Candidatus Cryptobacteroides sp.]